MQFDANAFLQVQDGSSLCLACGARSAHMHTLIRHAMQYQVQNVQHFVRVHRGCSFPDPASVSLIFCPALHADNKINSLVFAEVSISGMQSTADASMCNSFPLLALLQNIHHSMKLQLALTPNMSSWHALCFPGPDICRVV